MDEAFQAGTEAGRRNTLRKARQTALSALQQYEVHPSHVQFIQVSDHITYQVRTTTGQRYLLRLHSHLKSKEEVLSEIEWLGALSRRGNLVVPEGVDNRNGAHVTEIRTKNGFQNNVTVMKWIEGEHLKGDLTESQINKMGVLMAKLHDASSNFVPSDNFVRSSWDDKSFTRDYNRLKQHYRSFITDEEFELYGQAADKVVGELADIKDNTQDFGMIHADLHIGNFVFHNGDPYPIDFGRCGFGYYLYDLAQTLVGLYPVQRRLLVDAYARQRELPGDYAAVLACFFVMSLLESYSFHASNPRETAGLKSQQPYAQAILKHYLSGEPFLFNPIKIDHSV
ncbi:MAG: hypothetical protein JWR03_2380 [Cohnella sp.]|jgi:Ser/Thr protein kinase RdoA (MazF antagonist)|nr:hypothetical protein [Cohnella sp.]